MRRLLLALALLFVALPAHAAIYDIVWQAPYVQASTPTVGQAVSLDPSGTTYQPATTAYLVNGVFSGVIVAAQTVGTTNLVTVQVSGVIPASLTGLGGGTKSAVTVNQATGMLQRSATPSYQTDVIVGDCDVNGNLTISPSSRISPPSGATGATGPAGPAGANGANGQPSYTSLSTSYVQPSASSTVTITVASTTWMTATASVYVTTGGYYTVSSVVDATHVTLTNTGVTGNASAGTTISPSGTLVTAAGVQGPTGAAGSSNATQLQGYAIATTAPTSTYVLTWNGSAWAPAAPSGGSSVTWGGDLAGSTSTSQTVVSLSSANYIPVTKGFLLNGAAAVTSGAAVQQFPATGATSIWSTSTAGGALSAILAATSSSNAYFGSDSSLTAGTTANDTYLSGYFGLHFGIRGTPIFAANSTSVLLSAPAVGDGSSSPYALNGYTSITLATSRNFTAAEYANRFLKVHDNAIYTGTLPNLAGYDRVVTCDGSGTNCVIACGSGTTVTITAGKSAPLYCDGAGNAVRFGPDT